MEQHHIEQLVQQSNNVSGYVCNHGSPSEERDTASPRGRYGERRQRESCLKHTYKTQLAGWRQPMKSLPGATTVQRAPGEYIIYFFV